MARRTHAVILALLSIASTLLFGCGDGGANKSNAQKTSAAPNTAAQPQTNAEELGVLARMPYETLDIVWKEFPATKRLVAVLRYSPADANKIVAEAGGSPEGRTLQVEPWFPDELIAQSEMSGDNAVRGIAFPATAFYQEPYTQGTITRIEGSDYFILELTAK